MSVMIRLLEQRFFSKIALICFLLTLPLSVRKVLFVFPPYGTSGFNEYTDISLYLSDITLVVLLLFILLENKTSILSINYWKKLFHVEHMNGHEDQYKNVPRGTLELEQGFCWYKCSTWNKLAYILILPLPFLLWSTLSTLWSENEMLAFYASSRLFLGYFLYLALIFIIVPRGTSKIIDKSQLENRQCSTWNNQNDCDKNSKMFHVEHPLSEFEEGALFGNDVPRGTIWNRWLLLCMKCSTWNIINIISGTLIIGGFIQSVIAIWQFISQSSLHLTFLWESQIGPYQAGIAKIIYFDQVYIRSYGLFPHPNVLAVFLAFTIILTIRQDFAIRQKLFHVEQLSALSPNVPRGTLATCWKFVANLLTDTHSFFSNKKKILNITRMFHVEHFAISIRIALIVQVFGFLSTFSKGAALGLFLAISFLFYRVVSLVFRRYVTGNVPRETINRSDLINDRECSTWNIRSYILRMFHVEQFRNQIKIIMFAGIVGIFGMTINWYFFLIQPIKERFLLQKWAFSLFKEEPILGGGIGQSVLLIQNFSLEILEVWQFQPVHSLYFLVATELGIIGLLLFLAILLGIAKRMFHVEHLSQSIIDKVDVYFYSCLGIILLVTSFFDHYYWDLQQGQLLFWLVLGLIASQVYTKQVLTNIK